MSRTDDTPVRPITSKPIVRSDLARSWLIEAAKVLEQTGFEDEAWDIKTIAIKLKK